MNHAVPYCTQLVNLFVPVPYGTVPTRRRDELNIPYSHLEHTGEGLGVRLSARGQQVRHHGLAVVRIALHAAVVAPGVVQAVLQAGRGRWRRDGTGQAAQPPTCSLHPTVLTLCKKDNGFFYLGIGRSPDLNGQVGTVPTYIDRIP